MIDAVDEFWLQNALDVAGEICSKPFIPSKMAVDIFDEEKSMARLMKTIYD